MKITDRLFHAYLHCKTKCYLLSRGEVGLRSEYQQWRDAERQAYTERAVAFYAETISATIETNSRFKDGDESPHAKRAIITDVAVSTELLESTVRALDLRHQRASPALPLIAALHFHNTNKLSRNDKLMAAFDGIVLSERFGKRFVEAAIVYGDGYARTRANSPPMLTGAKKLIDELTSVVSATDPPELILNRHCAECEFQARCQEQAVEKDDLSLLPGMTEKERKKLHAKGIFTVTQLSYTYRPRRRSKHGKGRPEKYHHSLKALSLRLGKIHIVGELALAISATPVYLDVEGLPNSDFYYLIGLQCHTDRGVTLKSYWADGRKDEQRIWNAFLKELSEIDAPSILHYGGYEKAFFKRMIERYGFPASTTHVIQRAVLESLNVLSALYGKVYFPTRKNGLKQVAGFLGARWKHQDARGTDSIMWRTQWERSRDAAIKDRLMNYNQDDCEALHLLVTTLHRLIAGPKFQLTDISFPDDPKKLGTERAEAIHRSFDGLLKSAHSDYKAAKVSIRGAEPDSKRLKRPPFKRKWPKTPGHQVIVPRKRRCPNHSDVILKATRQMASCRVLDLLFTKSGCRKTIIHYIGKKAFCPDCQTAYVPPTIKRLKHIVFGRGWQVWGVYQRMVLRTSYRLISQAALDFFGEVVAAQNIQQFVTQLSSQYARTEDELLFAILQSPAIHIDETQINIVGANQYVWVFTDGSNVIFRLTETREAGFLVSLLKGYQGVIVSDFYAGYDSLPCAQQKCLVHLIRDLNDDLWKNPFNAEYEKFVADVRDLLTPIFDDVTRYGLKARHLRKHLKRVEVFYQQTILDHPASQEIISKYQKRFVRYEPSLFAFLASDDIPWNNNAAERAIRHLAVQRKISGSFTSKGAKDYLRLLGIAQTCRFQNKSFLEFLNSGQFSIAAFRGSRRPRVD